MNKFEFSIINQENTSANIGIDREADICPHCHRGISPEKGAGYLTGNELSIIFRCTYNDCRQIFIGYYSRNTNENSRSGYAFYNFKGTSTGTIQMKKFSTYIATLSPTFVDIYNQCLEAEQSGLNQLVGIGLRKALEFLIKDYLTKKSPEDEDAIKNSTLNNCIQTRIEDYQIKQIAERAVWLGNDETHYVRKWEDRDVSHLKVLIDITIHWIDKEHETEEVLKDMPDGKAK